MAPWGPCLGGGARAVLSDKTLLTIFRRVSTIQWCSPISHFPSTMRINVCSRIITWALFLQILGGPFNCKPGEIPPPPSLGSPENTYLQQYYNNTRTLKFLVKRPG